MLGLSSSATDQARVSRASAAHRRHAVRLDRHLTRIDLDSECVKGWRERRCDSGSNDVAIMDRTDDHCDSMVVVIDQYAARVAWNCHWLIVIRSNETGPLVEDTMFGRA